MIKHPNYVQKVFAADGTQQEKVRYIYPLPAGVKRVSQIEIGFNTKDGFTVFEFNFAFEPDAPTDADFAMCIPKSCETCLLKGFHDCPHPMQKSGNICPEWMYYPVQFWGEVAYYAKLHSERYGETLGSFAAE